MPECPTNGQGSWLIIKESCPKGPCVGLFHLSKIKIKKWGMGGCCEDIHWRKNLTETDLSEHEIGPEDCTDSRQHSDHSSRNIYGFDPHGLSLLVHSVLFFLTCFFFTPECITHPSGTPMCITSEFLQTPISASPNFRLPWYLMVLTLPQSLSLVSFQLFPPLE